MIPASLSTKVITMLNQASTGIDIVEGISSDQLPAPCVVVHVESAENFNISLTDVFRVDVNVRYEEHYADSTSAEVKQKFNLLVDQFMIDNLSETLQSGDYVVFNSQVTNIVSDIENDFFINEFTIQIILERTQ